MLIAVMAENMPDKEMACGLADRVLLEGTPDWLDEEQLGFERKWQGIEPGTDFTPWTSLSRLAKKENVRILGHKREEVGGFDYPSARKAIVLCLLAKHAEPIRAVLFIRDMDRQYQARRQSLIEARAHTDPTRLRVVLALPNRMREAWLLNGFIPKTPNEVHLHQIEREKLGFDPCESAELLTGRRASDYKGPKLVLASLTGGCAKRQEACWKDVPLVELADRGTQTGLKEFLQEVEFILVPLLTQIEN